MKFKIFSLSVFLFISSLAHGQMKRIQLSSDFYVEASRWQYESKQKPKFKNKKLIANLYKLKRNYLRSSWQACYNQARSLYDKDRIYRHWALYYRLLCAQKGVSQKKLKLALLKSEVQEAKKSGLLKELGSSSNKLFKQYAHALLVLLKKYSTIDRTQAWKTYSQLQGLQKQLSAVQWSRALFYAGQLSFVQQKLKNAYSYFKRSYELVPTQQLLRKLESVKETLRKKENLPVEPTVTQAGQSSELSQFYSEDEKKLFKQMELMIQEGDWVSAVKDGVELIQEYPGSKNTESAAQQILSIYLRLAASRLKKFDMLKKKVVSLMSKCDGVRIYNWTETIYMRGHFPDVVILTKESYKKLEGQKISFKPLRLLAMSSVFVGDYDVARNYFEELYKKNSGTELGQEALFRLALVSYRQKKYAEATGAFDKLLATGESNYELQARYWLWRAQQKLDQPRAKDEVKELIARYPFTYYGLRAQAEVSGGQVSWQQKIKKPIKIELWLTPLELQSWQRYQIFLQAGWLEEARDELKALHQPVTAEEKLVFANLWSLAMAYHKASALTNSAWDEKPKYKDLRFLSKIYPFDFMKDVKAWAKKQKIEPELVWSVIRQESSFVVDAVSSSKAKGLMQLIPSTAREVARDVRIKNLNTKTDLFNPSINIKLGSRYIKRMIMAFKGHVPLALAAYNVGIGRIRKWSQYRTEIKQLMTQHNSDPDNELWFDEMPWSETSFYVKAVMRNLLIYRLVGQKKATKTIKLSQPVWRFDP